MKAPLTMAALAARLDAQAVGQAPAGQDKLEGDGRPDPARARVEAPDGRPLVTLRVIELHEAVDRTAAVLRCDPTIFERSHELVTVVSSEAEPGKSDRAPIAKGTPIVHVLASSTVTERLTKVARFQKAATLTKAEQAILDEGGTVKPRLVPCLPPASVVTTLVARKAWPVPPLVGISETPIVRRDGTICMVPGYDESTGYYYAPSCELAPVPEHPTQAEAVAALAELEDVFCDFPHVTRADKLVPVAAILTVVARPAIDGSVPLTVLDASTRGSGKSLQGDVVSLVPTGRTAARLTYPETDEELDKVLGAYALSGASIILIDNVTRTLGGGPLDKVLTAVGDVDLRRLGATEMLRLPWVATLLASGNNVELGDDTIRRTLVSRLEPREESPEARTGFKRDPLIAWVRGERPRLLRAALVVIRAYAAKGWPAVDLPRWGGYEQWVRVVAGAIRFAGGPDVLACKPQADERGDGSLAALDIILAELPRLSGGRHMTIGGIVSTLFADRGQHDGQRPPDGWEGFREACETLASPRLGTWDAYAKRRLGDAFRRFKGRPRPGGRLDIARGADGRPLSVHGSGAWTVTGRP